MVVSLPEFDVNEFRKLFPNLSKEVLDSKTPTLNIRELSKDPLRDYTPNVYDFLGRVKSVEEGLKVIDYLESRGELSKELADRLREELRTKGVGAFGERRYFGYYYKLSSDRRRKERGI
ncbi:MAG: DUF2095 family protein [Sulfolobales archaeon]